MIENVVRLLQCWKKFEVERKFRAQLKFQANMAIEILFPFKMVAISARPHIFKMGNKIDKDFSFQVFYNVLNA